MPLNIIFAGTSNFALPCLQVLIDSSHQVIAVYTQPDRPAGRGQAMTSSPVKILATAKKIPVLQPQTLRDAIPQQQLRDLHPDIIVVVAYGIILPCEVLSIPRLGCINVHASLLPRWRGAAPIQHAILAGDMRTGITLMQMDAGLDTGAILAQIDCEILPDDTSGSLSNRLAPMGADILLKTLEKIVQGSITVRKQDNSQARYANKIQKKDASLNWQLSAENLARQVRAYHPAPIAHTIFNQQSLRVWQAVEIKEKHSEKPGTLLKVSEKGIDIAAGENILRLLQIQLPGKKQQAVRDFVRAYHQQLIPLKTRFGER